MLETNELAPDFQSLNQDGKMIKLSDFRNKKNVVLYFYPKDDTPGCTIEANQFTALINEFIQEDTVVIGVSKDSCESHKLFIDKFSLKFDLLADVTGELNKLYGVWQEKEKNGVKQMGIVRSTFIIDKSGILKEAMYGVNPEGHARETLDKIKQLY